MVNRQIGKTSVGRGSAQKRTKAAEFPEPIRNHTNADRRITISRVARISAMRRKEAANIILVVNLTPSFKKVPSNIRLHQMTYNEKGNLNRLLGVAATSSMVLPALKESILTTVRRVNPAIIDVIGDQKWH